MSVALCQLSLERELRAQAFWHGQQAREAGGALGFRGLLGALGRRGSKLD